MGGQWGRCLRPSPAPGVKANTGTSQPGGPHLSMVNPITMGYSRTSPHSHSGPAGVGAVDQAVPWSQLRAGSPAVGRPGICPGTTYTPVLPACFLPTLQGVANVASGHSHHLVPSSPSPAPPLALEPHSLHPHPDCKWEAAGAGLAGSGSPSAARAAARRASTRAGKSSLILGGRERSPPATVRAGVQLRPGPWHPLFAQPAPAGENKQAKVRAGEKGQRCSPTQHTLQSVSSQVRLWGTGLPMRAGSAESHQLCLCCQSLPRPGAGWALVQRAGGHSRPEPGTSFEVLPHLFHSKPHGIKAPSLHLKGKPFPSLVLARQKP